MAAGSRMIAGVPSSQALPAFFITAPPSVLVPAVLSTLAVWIQNKNKKQKNEDPLGLCGSGFGLVPLV